MSASEPGEIIPESSKAGVVPKFDMHIHISTLTSKELKEAINTYGIPMDLIPRLPDLDLIMDKLPANAIGVYVEQLEQGKRAKKCFKEITLSLKGWKKKFFLVDRRAIPDAMARRDRDTDVFDDFSISYNETHANMMAEKICENRHKFCCHGRVDHRISSSGLDTNITGSQREGALQLNTKKPDQKIFESMEKKEKQALIKIKAKRADESRVDGPNKKKKKTRKDVRSKSEKTISLEPLHKSYEFKKRTEGRYGSTKKYAKIPVVDLSDPTKDKSPPLNEMVQKSTSIGHANSQPDHENPSGANSSHSASGHHFDDDAAIGLFVPNWRFQNNLRICSYYASRELLSNLATLAEDVVLSELSNYKVNHGYLDLVNLHEGCHALADRLSEFGNAYERQLQLYEGLSKKFQLLENAHFVDRIEEDLGKILKQTDNLDIKGSKAWRTKYDELFMMKYPYVRKVADSYTLPFEELMKITPEVSSAPAKTVAENVKSSDPSVLASSVQAHPEDQVNTHE
ncbi:hypothetical protein Tco_0542939 [Tanacetum coccineum]